MKTIIITLALLLSISGAVAHPKHSCHSHGATQQCK
jgi:hypothetical protein